MKAVFLLLVIALVHAQNALNSNCNYGMLEIFPTKSFTAVYTATRSINGTATDIVSSAELYYDATGKWAASSYFTSDGVARAEKLTTTNGTCIVTVANQIERTCNTVQGGLEVLDVGLVSVGPVDVLAQNATHTTYRASSAAETQTWIVTNGNVVEYTSVKTSDSGTTTNLIIKYQSVTPSAVSSLILEPPSYCNKESSHDTSSQTESSKEESSKTESSKTESSKAESSKAESSKAESSKEESSHHDTSSKEESSKEESSHHDTSSKTESSKEESSKEESSHHDTSSKEESSKTESSKTESSKTESSKTESSKTESSKAESSKEESSKEESSQESTENCSYQGVFYGTLEGQEDVVIPSGQVWFNNCTKDIVAEYHESVNGAAKQIVKMRVGAALYTVDTINRTCTKSDFRLSDFFLGLEDLDNATVTSSGSGYTLSETKDGVKYEKTYNAQGVLVGASQVTETVTSKINYIYVVPIAGIPVAITTPPAYANCP